MTREISITNRHPRLRFSRPAVAQAVAVLDAHAAKFLGGCPAGELSLVFLTDPALAKIHGDFMDDPTATDVITFEGNPAAGLAGEICVSADTAAKYVGLLEGRARAKVERVAPQRALSAGRQTSALGSSALHPVGSPTLQNKFATELTLYVVHGWLHLAGYDDLEPAKKRRMRAAEARALKLLSTAKAIPAFQLV